jgi:hypothetical protein
MAADQKGLFVLIINNGLYASLQAWFTAEGDDLLTVNHLR